MARSHLPMYERVCKAVEIFEDADEAEMRPGALKAKDIPYAQTWKTIASKQNRLLQEILSGGWLAYDDAVDDEVIELPRTTYAVGLTVTEFRPFVFEGLKYNTAMNAFQAKKESDPTQRARFAEVTIGEAAKMGRACQIDIVKWNAQRSDLMFDILYEQAQQIDKLRETIVKNADPALIESSINDDYWILELPKIWVRLAETIRKEGESSSSTLAGSSATSPAKRQKTAQLVF